MNVPSLYSKRGEYRAYKYKPVGREEALRRVMEADGAVQRFRAQERVGQEDLKVGGWRYYTGDDQAGPYSWPDARAVCTVRDLMEEFEQLLDGDDDGWPITQGWYPPGTGGMAWTITSRPESGT